MTRSLSVLSVDTGDSINMLHVLRTAAGRLT